MNTWPVDLQLCRLAATVRAILKLKHSDDRCLSTIFDTDDVVSFVSDLACRNDCIEVNRCRGLYTPEWWTCVYRVYQMNRIRGRLTRRMGHECSNENVFPSRHGRSRRQVISCLLENEAIRVA